MATITQDSIRELAGFRSDGAPVVSCYLDVDGRRLVRSKDVEVELERLLRGARQNGGADLEVDLRKIESYVQDGIDRSSTRGLAIFSCTDGDLWEVVPLPVPVTSRIVINQAPAVGQLEALVQELDRFGVLLVDRQRARIFIFEFGELIDRSELFEAKPRGYDSRGERDRESYDKAGQHVEELATQHLRHAAEVTFQLFQDHRLDHLAVGAPDDLVSTVEGLLHPYLRERLSPRIEVPVTAGVDEVRRAVIEVEARVERQREAATIERLRDEVGRGGRGVVGLDGTLQALAERRVEQLIVSQGYVETGWRCGQCGYLCHVGPTCPVDGSQMTRVDDIVEEAVDTAFGQSCRVEVCVGNADLDVLGRIGALLRF